MTTLSRRSLLRASLGVAAAGSLARPYLANAAATTAEVWWTQGLIQEEDVAFRKAVAGYEAASGNKIDYTIIPGAGARQKNIAALTSGVVPDLMDGNPPNVVPEQAWDDMLLDVTDVIETQKSQFHPTALLAARCYNNVTKKHGFYCVPYRNAVTPFHIWGSLVEKAGYKISDIPKTWDAFIDFFKPVQQKLQAQGMRHTYALGFVVSSVGIDPANTFDHFLLAYGGEGIVTEDGRLHSDNPQVKEAAIKALEKLTSLYKEGYIPSSSVNWQDADDNNAFHSQLCVTDFDGSLSTEVAMLKQQRDAYYHEVITQGMPLSNAGKPLPSLSLVWPTMVPKGAKNVAVAKDFMKYMIQPEVNAQFLKGGLGRWLPVMPEIAKNDPWWTDPKLDPHRPPYVQQGLFSPTLPYYYMFNPAYAQVWTEHVWNVAFSDIVTGRTTLAEAAAKAWQRIEAIFAKYPIQQT